MDDVFDGLPEDLPDSSADHQPGEHSAEHHEADANHQHTIDGPHDAQTTSGDQTVAGEAEGAAPTEVSDFSVLSQQLLVYAQGPDAPDLWTSPLPSGDLSDALTTHEPPDPAQVEAFIERTLESLGSGADADDSPW